NANDDRSLLQTDRLIKQVAATGPANGRNANIQHSHAERGTRIDGDSSNSNSTTSSMRSKRSGNLNASTGTLQTNNSGIESSHSGGLPRDLSQNRSFDLP